MSETHGTVIWSELMTRDVEGARRYYADRLGWRIEAMPMAGDAGDYLVAFRGDEMVAGLVDMTAMPGMEGLPPHWFTYFAVDDVDAAAEATAAAGGTVIRPPFDVPGVGRIAILHDPTGAAMGLMTPS